ncbi:dopamine beta-hydroxylase-like protein [Corchorus olitorius]|uniref:Dopamine beta-hydroxylase-like protein n=1 Tax=Corchorus olitorius TaxID=93759 RepID=A0A1R3KJP0_9ROSI|nr:dopamine beta-hydroxylase-like protein [Corchorus olitorius]
MLPGNRFKDAIFKKWYDDVTEFDIVLARTIDLKSFRNDPDFRGLKLWFEKAYYSEELVSPSLVREFYANIVHDIIEVKEIDIWKEDVVVNWVNGFEVRFSSNYIGERLNIYADPALESEPGEDFDRVEAWKIISGK